MVRRIAEDLLYSNDLQKIFGVTPLTIVKWRKKGLPFFRVGRARINSKGNVMFDVHEVLKWAEENHKEVKISPEELMDEFLKD
jgi:hypothetical protein